MRAWQIVQGFGLNNLNLTEVVDSPLGPKDVRVRIHACSLNYRDLMVIKGQYNPKFVLPLIPLSDGAGEVVEIGSQVSSLAVGTRVCATFSQRWCHGPPSAEVMKSSLGGPLAGTLSQYRVFDENGLMRFPEHLSYVEASTLPCAALTAFNAIALTAALTPGDAVLLEGTGGVSIFALQFAKIFDLRAILISSSDDKIERARALSELDAINYEKKPDWQKEVLDLTDGLGVDAVIEVGGAKTLPRAIASVKKGGMICLIGVLSGANDAIDIRPILMNSIRIHGILVGPRTAFTAMNRVIEHSGLRPVVDKVFGFDEVPSALAYLDSQAHFGKVCISLT